MASIDPLQYLPAHIWYQNVQYNWQKDIMQFIYDFGGNKMLSFCIKVSLYSSGSVHRHKEFGEKVEISSDSIEVG